MIWEKTKKGVLEVGEEKFPFEIKVPTALEMEDIVDNAVIRESGNVKLRSSYIVKKCLLSIEGFRDAEEFLNTPGTAALVNALGNIIVDAGTLKVELKN